MLALRAGSPTLSKSKVIASSFTFADDLPSVIMLFSSSIATGAKSSKLLFSSRMSMHLLYAKEQGMIDKNAPVHWKTTLSDGDHLRMFGRFGLKPIVILLSSSLPEVLQRLRKHQAANGYEILNVNKDIKGFQYSPAIEGWCCDPQTCINYLRMRSDRNNVVFFTIHSAINWQSLDRLRSVVPDAKVVAYVYDWQNLFVKREDLHVWDQYTENGSKYAALELDIIDKALEGKMVDSLIYGDYGNDWDYLKSRDIPGGCHWVPRSSRLELYQPQPKVDVENRCIFLATVLDKARFSKKDILFPETHIIPLQKRICDDGYKIDIFTLGPKKEVVEDYAKEFPHKMVRIHSGMPLKNLLPVVSQRYKYGLMLYDWETHLTDAHDACSMPTKFFTYLAMGIPTLISSRLKSVARHVEQNKCGIVFQDGDTKNFAKIVESYDYAELLKNVAACREKYAADNFDERFVGAIVNVMNMPKEKTVWWRLKNGAHPV